MNEIKRVLTFKDLDNILPLIAELHQQNREYMHLFTKSGYYAWLVSMFPHLAIWAGYEDGIAIGYIIVGIQLTYGEKEAIIYEALCHGNRSIVSDTWEEVLQWAEDNGCRFISCYSTRGKALTRKYGFTCVRQYLTKEI